MKTLIRTLCCGMFLLLLHITAQAQNLAHGQWTWIAGSDNQLDLPGVYGTKGVGATGNLPGSRQGSLTWTDNNGKLWLMGGYGLSSSASGIANLNDLWKYDPATNFWTWVSGSDSFTSRPRMGVKGVASADNEPGARKQAVKWKDTDGNLWLLGGEGYVNSGYPSLTSDLWKYNISTGVWTWMNGSDQVDQAGVYGTRGVASASNMPGARRGAVSWTDAYGSFWLMGGFGCASTTTKGYLNDLWTYNKSNNQWTWVGGSNTINNNGSYGIIKVGAYTNTPGAREGAVSWADSQGNLWLMGGLRSRTGTYPLESNDVWKYNTNTRVWTWVGGSQYPNGQSTHGTKGVPANDNIPASRQYASALIDKLGNAWLTAGIKNGVYFSDLWKFNTATGQWTWVEGDEAKLNIAGIYGIKGTPAEANHPDGRYESNAWLDGSGNIWLQGGYGFFNSNSTAYGQHNDLWAYKTTYSAPTIQASNILLNTTTTQATIKWNNGNGTARAVFIKEGEAGSPLPLDSKAYTANQNFGSGIQIDTSGWYCVYNGPDSEVVVNGLTSGTAYVVSVKEYNGVTGSEVYNQAFNTVGTSTPAVPVTLQGGQWTWASGSKLTNKRNVESPLITVGTTPGGLSNAAKWVDAEGNFWLLGGFGYVEGYAKNTGALWKYNKNAGQWSVINQGLSNQFGIYGSKGIEAVANKPGTRQSASTWTDKQGNLWLFGGSGSSASSTGMLSDMWKYNTASNRWTWVNGSAGTYANGNYGTKGTPAASNAPGSRQNAITWTDKQGNFWMFGGYGYFNSTFTYSNDLWKYDTNTNLWTWVSGSSSASARGVFGTIGVASTANMPGARSLSSGWTDVDGNLWLMGGYGYATSSAGVLNDLWKYNITTNEWTWVSGSNTINQPGVNGTKGITVAANVPSARHSFSAWTDKQGNLWLTGGRTFEYSYVSELWKFNIKSNMWTWVSGSNTANSTSVFGTKGTPTETTMPGSRYQAANWTDADGNFWLLGGYGYTDNFYKQGYLSDMWVYNPINVDSPTLQASQIAFTSITATGSKLSWTNGDGVSRVVFLKKTNTGNPVPINNTNYTANATFGSGTQISTSGWYSVYNGAGNTVTLTGLEAGATYRAVVIEYNGTTGTQNYFNTVTLANVANVTTYPVISSLVLNQGKLYPALSNTERNYLLNVMAGTKSIVFKPTASQAGSTITVNGSALPNGSPSTFQVNTGTTNVNIKVTAPDSLTSSNYQLRINVGKVKPNLTFAGLPVKTYGDADFAPGAITTAPDMPISYISTNPKVAIIVNGMLHLTGAGITTIKAQQLGNDDYTISNYVNQKLTVNKALVTVKVKNSTRSYGSDNPAFTMSYTGFVNGDTDAALKARPIITTTAGLRSGAGTYALTATRGSSANYTLNYQSGSLTITPIELIVKAIDITKAYGAKPIFKATYSGFKSWDNYSKLTTQVQFTGVTAATPTGKEGITPYGASSPNYIISYENGTATIVPALLKILANNQSKEQGSPNGELTFTGIGFVNGDNYTNLITQPVLSTTANTTSAVGKYPIYVSSASSANYNISYTNNWLTIVKASSPVMLNANTGYSAKSIATFNAIGNQSTEAIAGKSRLIVHQALSPNGDGQNDFMYIEGIEHFPANKVTVYNSSGMVLVEINGYDNASRVFDGRVKGNLQQPGTYFYTIAYQDNNQNFYKSGFIIIKN